MTDTSDAETQFLRDSMGNFARPTGGGASITFPSADPLPLATDLHTPLGFTDLLDANFIVPFTYNDLTDVLLVDGASAFSGAVSFTLATSTVTIHEPGLYQFMWSVFLNNPGGTDEQFPVSLVFDLFSTDGSININWSDRSNTFIKAGLGAQVDETRVYWCGAGSTFQLQVVLPVAGTINTDASLYVYKLA